MPRWPWQRRTVEKAAPTLDAFGVPTSSQSLSSMAAQMGHGQGNMGLGRQQGDAVQFGPLEPPAPTPLGNDPRQWPYRMGWNLPSLPGEGRPVSYDTVRALSRNFSVLRKCIEIRKDQVATLTFDLKARDSDKRKARQILESQQSDIQRVREFFRKPDRKHTFGAWLKLVMEDHLLYDAVCIYKRRTLDPDAGPVSQVSGHPLGGIHALELISAPTIKPMVDSGGRTPEPPATAYQQYLYGIPRYDFTSEEFIYAVKSPSLDTPYGFSHVEQFLDFINLSLRYWTSMAAIYTDGTLPEGVAVGPPDWSPQQLLEYSSWWNALLAGDPKALRKLQWVPHGTDFHLFQEHVFDEKFARFLTDQCIAHMDLTPIEFGLEPSHGGLGGKGLGETVSEVAERRGVKPFTQFLLNEVINPIIWDEFGLVDLEGTFTELDNQEEQERSTAINLGIRNGSLNIDDIAEQEGEEPPGWGRFYETSNGVILFDVDMKRGATEGSAALGLIVSPEQRQQQAEAQAQALAARTQNGNGDNSDSAPTDRGESGQPGPSEDSKPSTTRETASDGNKPLSTADKVAEVKRWEQKVLRAIKGGKNPSEVRFATDALPGTAVETVRSLLDGADAAAARRVFRDTRLALEAAAVEIDAQLAVAGL